MGRPRKITGPAVFDEEAGTVQALSDVAAVATLEEAPVSPPAVSSRYRVSLALPKPLTIRFPSLEVEATSEAEAKAAFDAANRISGSEHAYTITRL
jgi:hypothetical protein